MPPIRSDFELDVQSALDQIQSLEEAITGAIDTASSGLGSSLAAAIDDVQGTTIDIAADVSEAQETVQAFGDDIPPTVIPIEADTEPFTDSLGQVVEDVNATDIEIPVGADLDEALANLDAFFEAAKQEVITRMTIDPEGLQSEAADAAAGIDLPPIVVPVDATIEEALEVLEELKQAAQEEIVTKLTVDDSDLQEQVSDAVDRVAPEDIGVGVDFDSGGAEEDIGDLNEALGDTEAAGSQAGGSLAGVATATQGLAAGVDLASGKTKELTSAIAAGGGASATMIGGIAGIGAAIHTFVSEGQTAVAAQERLNLVFGEFADVATDLDVGGLTGELGDLATQAGASGPALEQSVAKIGQMAQAAGRTAPEAAEAAKQIAALGLRASATNPQLGDAARVTDQLTRFLAVGGPRLARYGIDLSKAEISARALAIAHEQGRVAATNFDRTIAGSQLALEKLGDTVGPDFQKGIEQTTVQFKSLTQQISTAVEAAGAPLVQPALEVVQSLIPIAQSVAGVIGKVLEGVLALAGPSIEVLGEVFTDILSGFGPALEELIPPLGELGVALGDFLKEFAPIITDLAPIGAEGFAALAPVISLVADALNLVTAAIGPLIPLMDLLLTWPAKFGELLVNLAGNAIGPIVDGFSRLGDAISPVVDFVGNVLDPVFSAAAPVVQTLANAVKVLAIVVGTLVLGPPIVAGIAAFEGLKFTIEKVGEALAPFIDLWQSLAGVIGSVGSAVGGAFGSAFNQLGNLVETFADSLDALGRGTVAVLGPVVSFVGDAIPAAVGVARDAIAPFIELWHELLGVAATVGGAIGDAFGSAFNQFGNLVETIADTLDALGHATVTAVQPIIAAFGAMRDAVGDVIGPIADAIGDLIGLLGDLGGAVGSIGDILGGLGDKVTGALGPIGDVISGVGDKVGSVVSGIGGAIGGMFGGGGGDDAKKDAEELQATVDSMADSLFGSVDSADALAAAVSGLRDTLVEFTQTQIDDATDKVKEGFDKLGVSAELLADTLKEGPEAIDGLANNLRNAGFNDAADEVLRLREAFQQSTHTAIEARVSAGDLSRAQADAILNANGWGTANFDAARALDQATAAANRHAVSVRDAAIQTSQASGEFVRLRDAVLSGAIGLDNIQEVMDATGLSAEDATAFIKSLNTQLDSFVNEVVSKLPAAGDAVGDFSQGAQSALDAFNKSLSKDARSGITDAQERLTAAQNDLADAERKGGENQARAIESARERVDDARADVLKAEQEFAQEHRDAKAELEEATDPSTFTRNIQQQIATVNEFFLRIAFLADKGFDDLAASLAKAGPEAGAALAKAMAEDLPEAAKADKTLIALDDTKTKITDFVRDELGPQMVGAFVTLADGTQIAIDEHFGEIPKALKRQLDKIDEELETGIGNISKKKLTPFQRANLEETAGNIRGREGEAAKAATAKAAAEEQGKQATESFKGTFDPATAAKDRLAEVPPAISAANVPTRDAAGVVGSSVGQAFADGARNSLNATLPGAFTAIIGILGTTDATTAPFAGIVGASIAGNLADGLRLGLNSTLPAAFNGSQAAILAGAVQVRGIAALAGSSTANAFAFTLASALAETIPHSFATAAPAVARGGVQTRQAAVEAGEDTADSVGAGLTIGLVTEIPDSFSTAIPSVVGGSLILSGAAFSAGLGTAASVVAGLRIGLAGGIPTSFGGLEQQMTVSGISIGAALDQGVALGITSAAVLPMLAARSLIDAMVADFRKHAGVRSPSTVFRDLAVEIPRGIVAGLNDPREQQRAAEAIGGITSRLVTVSEQQLSRIADVGVSFTPFLNSAEDALEGFRPSFHVSDAVDSEVTQVRVNLTRLDDTLADGLQGVMATASTSLSTSAADASAAFRLNLAKKVDDEVNETRNALSRAETTLASGGTRVAERIQVAISQVRQATGASAKLPTQVVQSPAAPPLSQGTGIIAQIKESEVQRATDKKSVEIHQTFNEKVDPLHVAAELGWRLGSP